MTTDELVDGLLEREGGFRNVATDPGGATKYGITSKALGMWRQLNRQATIAEVKALTMAEARAIYKAEYVRPFEAIPFDELKAQLVDYGVLSGQVTAIRALQQILRVPVDGVIGPRTKAALVALSWPIANNLLVAQRVGFFVDIVDRDPDQLREFHGWCKRAVGFLVDR